MNELKTNVESKPQNDDSSRFELLVSPKIKFGGVMIVDFENKVEQLMNLCAEQGQSSICMDVAASWRAEKIRELKSELIKSNQLEKLVMPKIAEEINNILPKLLMNFYERRTLAGRLIGRYFIPEDQITLTLKKVEKILCSDI